MERSFYEQRYTEAGYSNATNPEDHGFSTELKTFVEQYFLQNKRCLEVGCGRGAFQDQVDDYTGIDIAFSLRPYLRKPFLVSSATDLPFADETFEAIWSITVLEHIPNPEKALNEMRRVLKDGGRLFLAPAWQCRSWAAKGYPVRPYSDFDLVGKLVKASIPIRNAVWFRALRTFPIRLARMCMWLVTQLPTQFNFKELTPNYETFWMSDSDAVNSMDPLEAILWFRSRRDECLSHRSILSQFFVRTGTVIFRINKTCGK